MEQGVITKWKNKENVLFVLIYFASVTFLPGSYKEKLLKWCVLTDKEMTASRNDIRRGHTVLFLSTNNL